jgi:hypothetical protein
MYHLRDSVLPADQDLFCPSLETHLARPLSALKGWLAIIKDLILWSVRTAKLQSKSGTCALSNYFSSVPRPKRSPRPKHKHTPKVPRPSIPTRLTSFFRPAAQAHRFPRPQPPTSPTHTPPKSPRQRRIVDFFPDHPS